MIVCVGLAEHIHTKKIRFVLGFFSKRSVSFLWLSAK